MVLARIGHSASVGEVSTGGVEGNELRKDKGVILEAQSESEGMELLALGQGAAEGRAREEEVEGAREEDEARGRVEAAKQGEDGEGVGEMADGRGRANGVHEGGKAIGVRRWREGLRWLRRR